MSSNSERRTGIRATMPARFYFNILKSDDEYSRDGGEVIRHLGTINAAEIPAPETATQMFLSQIDQKLTLIVSMLAEHSRQKSYLRYGVTQGISEYGLSFNHKLALSEGTFLEVGLQMAGDRCHLLDILGHITHVTKLPEPVPPGTTNYGVEFIDIQSKDQNEIIQGIFSYQRDQISRRRQETT